MLSHTFTRALSRALVLTGLVAATFASAPETAQAQPEDSALAEAALDEIFSKQAHHGEFGRYVGGIGGIAVGGAGLATGIWLMSDDPAWDNRDLQLLTGGALLAMGTMAMANGIFSLATPSFGAERYERFQLARADGLTERDLGMFEGELRLDAERARRRRTMSIVTGAGKVIGGVGIVIATAVADTSQGQADFGYVVGSVAAGLGLLTIFKSLFCRSHAERVWEGYQNGEYPTPPETAGVQLEVAPAVGPTMGGLSVAGTF